MERDRKRWEKRREAGQGVAWGHERSGRWGGKESRRWIAYGKWRRAPARAETAEHGGSGEKERAKEAELVFQNDVVEVERESESYCGAGRIQTYAMMEVEAALIEGCYRRMRFVLDRMPVAPWTGRCATALVDRQRLED